MAAIEGGLAGQAAQGIERVPHLGHGSFDYSAAAERKQNIADQGQCLAWQVVDNMSLGVARRKNHVH